jgi:signal transduction histidine kinase
MFDPKLIGACDFIEEIIEMYRPFAKNKNISLQFNCENDIIVYADKNLLKTIIRNLVNNAIKFSNEFQKVEVSVKQLENGVEIIVSDKGVGMNLLAVEKLWANENNSTVGTSKEKGTGLGLWLCKSFVDMHGGEIKVESEQNKGTNFVVLLPHKNLVNSTQKNA